MFSGGEVTFDSRAIRAFKADIEAACTGRLKDIKTEEVRTLLGLPLSNEAREVLATDRLGNNGFKGQVRFCVSAPSMPKSPDERLAEKIKAACAHFKKTQGK